MNKVDVLTINDEDVEFRWLRWWSNWIDVCVFNSGSHGNLLQMRISRTNAKQFKCVSFDGYLTVVQAGDLTQMERQLSDDYEQ